MNIGILTFHYTYNFGAMLQVYALQETLKQINKDYIVYVVDYSKEPYEQRNKYDRWSKPNPKKFIPMLKYLIKRPIYYCVRENLNLRKSNFLKFYKNINVTEKKIQDWREIGNLNLDVYICGSDQIWNPKITQKLDGAFFAEFKVSNNAKKISYAASVGGLSELKGYEEEFLKKIRNFQYLSVREKELEEFIKEKNITVTQVLDPTLLLPKEYYDNVCSERLIKEKYILVYELAKDPQIMKTAKLLSEKYGLKIIDIYEYPRLIGQRYKVFNIAGPSEFLSLIKYADYVIGSSFHGVAFSIIFEREFYVVKHETRNDRMESLLQALELKERFIDKEKMLEERKIDYLKVKDKLNILKKNSIEFLKDALSNSMKKGDER